jgi:hypothetical protein
MSEINIFKPDLLKFANMKTILRPSMIMRMRYITSLFLFLAITGFCTVVQAQTVTIFTDKDDYYPGEWVIITGSGWQDDDSVKLTLTHIEPNIPNHDHEIWYVLPDQSGNIYDEWFVLDQELGTTFMLEALGVPTDNYAVTYFTDTPKVVQTVVGNQTGSICPDGSGEVTYNVTVEKEKSKTAVSVDLCVKNLPSGVTGSFSPASLNFTDGGPLTLSSTLTLSATLTPEQVSEFIVRAYSPGPATCYNDRGDYAEGSGIYKVEDKVAPVAIAQNVTVTLDATGNGSTTAALVDNGSNDA